MFTLKNILFAVIILQFLFTSYSAIKIFLKHRYETKTKDYAGFVKAYLIIAGLSLGYIPFFFLVTVGGYHAVVGSLIAIANWSLRDNVLQLSPDPKAKKAK